MLNSEERREALQKAVCSIYKINEEMLFSHRRNANIVGARRMVLYFLRKHYGEPYINIAKLFSMNHATVIHHFKQMENYLSYNKEDIINYIKVRDYVFEQNSEVTLKEELDILLTEKELLEDRVTQIKNELNILNDGN